MKKIKVAVITAAAITMAASTAVCAEAGVKAEAGGIAFEIPDELADLVVVKTEGLDENVLIGVYEKGSVEASEAMGQDNETAGWIFSISTVPEADALKMRCYGMDGMDIFAGNGETCLVYEHPTDVRFVRETPEEMENDQEIWSMVNNWAFENVREEILANNPDYEPEVYTNTNLDMYLARAAYDPDTKFVLRSLDYEAGADLDPAEIGENDFIMELTEDFTYEYASDEEEADGEYYVMEFPEDNIRFDFIKSDDNLVRETITTEDGEEFVTLYTANPKNADNSDADIASIVGAFCEAIAEAK